jgi:hypothetical protein
MKDEPPLVNDATAWKGADYANDRSWIYTLSAPEVEELAAAARRCVSRGVEVTDIQAPDFPLGSLAPTIRGWAEEINDGRGFLLVKGLPRERFSDAEVRTMFWGIGRYLGVPVSQNSYGDMLGDVYDEGVKLGARVRGYRTNQLLRFHSDRCDMVGLLCVRQAREGGLSSLVSSTRVWNEIVTHRPEYIAPLMNGYFYVSVEEGGDVVPRRVPVYSMENGVVSCRILRNTIETARKMGHANYSELEEAALEYMDELVNRDDLRLDMMLGPGDMQFINNYTTLHARTEFEDYPEPERKRWMVRLWLHSFGLRRPRRAELFRDYEGVEKTLSRELRAAGHQPPAAS